MSQSHRARGETSPEKGAYRVALLTMSDKGARGEREDESGRVMREMAETLPGEVVFYEIIPDEARIIEEKLCELTDGLRADLILTTGGTGLAPRDVTPEATRAVIDREVPGMAEAMRAASMAQTPHAMISRAVCGVRKRTLIINLPGSPRAVRENLAVILPALTHAIDKLRGDPSDCAAP